LGRNDPFLASELTDSVMHFVEQDFAGRMIGPQDLVATVTKVISELGHPQLAIAIENDWTDTSRADTSIDVATHGAAISPDDCIQMARKQLRDYSLTHVYPSSIVAAQELGLIELQDLDLPFVLIGGIVDLNRHAWQSEHGLVSAIALARHRFGRFVELKLSDESPQTRSPADLCATLAASLDLAQLRAMIHVPRRATSPGEGATLFAEVDPEGAEPTRNKGQLFQDEIPAVSPNSERLGWVRAIVQAASRRMLPVVAVSAADFEDVTFIELMHVLVVNAVPAIVTFARGESAGWQVTGRRNHCPAELASVRANLPAILAHFEECDDADTNLERLGGLVRLAFAAGRAKQTFLRRHGHSSQREAFLLERSAVVVTPIGIAEFTRTIAREQRTPAEVESKVVQQLNAAARQCSAHGPQCVLRYPRFSIKTPEAAVPGYYDEISLSHRGSGRELVDALYRLHRETKVFAVWINGDDCS
jgi:hypothetical protein